MCAVQKVKRNKNGLEKKNLSQDDELLLKKIFEFSGYTTAISINNYFPEHSRRAMQYKLSDFVRSNFLKEMKFYCDSDRYPTVYQVTGKTSRLFDNPDSYFRKKHNDVYIFRALMKQHFLFEICRDFEANIVSNHDKRLNLLVNEIGFSLDALPVKTNKGTSFVHVEECILDLRDSGKTLVCKTTNEELFCGGRIVITYIDKYQSNFAEQLRTVINKYRPILDMELVRIDFLIVVDSERNHTKYREAIKRMGFEKKVFEIPYKIVELYYRTLEDKLRVLELEPFADFVRNLRSKYSVIQQVVEEDFKDIQVKEITQSGIAAIENLTTSILNSSLSNVEKRDELASKFKKIFKLYASGTFDINSNFGIKIYRIGHKFTIN